MNIELATLQDGGVMLVSDRRGGGNENVHGKDAKNQEAVETVEVVETTTEVKRVSS